MRLDVQQARLIPILILVMLCTLPCDLPVRWVASQLVRALKKLHATATTTSGDAAGTDSADAARPTTAKISMVTVAAALPVSGCSVCSTCRIGLCRALVGCILVRSYRL
jgi:hypothetical protein